METESQGKPLKNFCCGHFEVTLGSSVRGQRKMIFIFNTGTAEMFQWKF